MTKTANWGFYLAATSASTCTFTAKQSLSVRYSARVLRLKCIIPKTNFSKKNKIITTTLKSKPSSILAVWAGASLWVKVLSDLHSTRPLFFLSSFPIFWCQTLQERWDSCRLSHSPSPQPPPSVFLLLISLSARPPHPPPSPCSAPCSGPAQLSSSLSTSQTVN